MKPYLVLLLGIVASATSPFLIKWTVPLGPASLASARMLIACAILFPVFRLKLLARGRPFGRDDLIASLPGAVLFAIHQASWTIGVRATTAVMSTLIINLNTVLMPFLVYLLLRERIRLGEAVGSAVGLAGVVWLALGKDASGVTQPYGIATCIGSIVFCAAYFAMGRRFGRGRHIVVYIVPLYLIAGLMTLAFALATREALPPFSWRLLGAVVAAAAIPTVLGHTAMNYAMVHLPSQVVSMSNPAQVALIGVAAMPLLGEYPGWRVLAPAGVIVAGVAIVIRAAPRRVQQEIDRATAEPPGT